MGSSSTLGFAWSRSVEPLAFWMQTMGACQVGTITAARRRCLRLYMRVVVRPCCCTSCCKDLTLTRQVNSVRLPLATLAQLALAFSSEAKSWCGLPRLRHVRSWETPSIDVRWRPLLWVVIVTHLIARTLASQASLAEADIASRYYVSAGPDITPYKQRQSNWGPE